MTIDNAPAEENADESDTSASPETSDTADTADSQNSPAAPDNSTTSIAPEASDVVDVPDSREDPNALDAPDALSNAPHLETPTIPTIPTTPASSPVAAVSPAPPRPKSTRRLSVWRVLLALVIVGVLTTGGYGGWQWWNSTRAIAAHTPWFAGYVDVTATPSYAFEAPETLEQKNVVLSFVVASTDDPCTPSWGTYYSLDDAADSLDLDRRIARLEQLGGTATVSFGGFLNNELATVCTDESALADAYAEVVDRYNLTAIDLDVEGENLTNTEAGARRASAIRTVQDERLAAGTPLDVWLTLPTATFGMTAEGSTAVAQMLEAGVDLTGVNAMTMNYGASRDADESMGDAAIKALTATHEQLRVLYTAATKGGANVPTSAALWAKIGATPMVGQNDIAGEIFTLADATALSTFAQEKSIGRMSMWSLNRDRTCGPNYADLSRVSDACSGVDQDDTLFSTVLGNHFASAAATAAATSPSATPSTPSTTSDVTGEGGLQQPTAPVDDPATSPYEIWATDSIFQKGTKVVWHGNVYEAKNWTKGDVPDNPALSKSETPWSLIGPVLPGDTPRVPILLPAGTYTDWAADIAYRSGDRVLVDDVPFEAKWWTQGDAPGLQSVDDVPWRILTADEVEAVLKSLDAAADATPNGQ